MKKVNPAPLLTKEDRQYVKTQIREALTGIKNRLYDVGDMIETLNGGKLPQGYSAAENELFSAIVKYQSACQNFAS